MNNFEQSKLETIKHKQQVKEFILEVITLLENRAEHHDDTKLLSPEIEVFSEYTPKLKNSTYGSEEYENFRKEMKVALDHHYGNNRHHPEHFANGIKDMNLLDLIEMICDWKASTLRHNDGNILMSIDKNKERFGYSEDLAQIFRNTVQLFERQ